MFPQFVIDRIMETEQIYIEMSFYGCSLDDVRFAAEKMALVSKRDAMTVLRFLRNMEKKRPGHLDRLVKLAKELEI